MGRRSHQVRLPAHRQPDNVQAALDTRDTIRRHMARVSVHNFNLARLRAQTHEEEMVEVLYGIATDPEMAPVLRRQCAIDVLEQARGKITMQIHDGATITPSDPATDGTDRTVGEQIEAARTAASEMTAIQEWASVPFHQWPERVRALLGADMGSAFVEIEATIEPEKGKPSPVRVNGKGV
jgi:hypothetical protein